MRCDGSRDGWMKEWQLKASLTFTEVNKEHFEGCLEIKMNPLWLSVAYSKVWKIYLSEILLSVVKFIGFLPTNTKEVFLGMVRKSWLWRKPSPRMHKESLEANFMQKTNIICGLLKHFQLEHNNIPR